MTVAAVSAVQGQFREVGLGRLAKSSQRSVQPQLRAIGAHGFSFRAAEHSAEMEDGTPEPPRDLADRQPRGGRCFEKPLRLEDERLLPAAWMHGGGRLSHRLFSRAGDSDE